MTQIEARNRISSASWALIAHAGWTQAQVARLTDGLYRDDAVEAIERAANAATAHIDAGERASGCQ